MLLIIIIRQLGVGEACVCERVDNEAEQNNGEYLFGIPIPQWGFGCISWKVENKYADYLVVYVNLRTATPPPLPPHPPILHMPLKADATN